MQMETPCAVLNTQGQTKLKHQEESKVLVLSLLTVTSFLSFEGEAFLSITQLMVKYSVLVESYSSWKYEFQSS